MDYILTILWVFYLTIYREISTSRTIIISMKIVTSDHCMRLSLLALRSTFKMDAILDVVGLVHLAILV